MTVQVRRATLGLVIVAMVQAFLVSAGSPAVLAAGTAVAAKPPCQRPAHGFVPVKAAVPAIGRTLRVIQVKRTSSGAVGAGPVTEEGKWLMAMDPQTKPASRRGTVLLSGHTWPDGSALGNAMLRNLDEGNRVTLIGKSGQRACYRITERTSYPAGDVPRNKTFRYWGPEQLVIVTCSGTRTSPGHWTRRTVWYGVPVTPAAPPPPNPPAPEPAPPPSLLGGLLSGLLGG